jgi:hypothetical protein
VDHFQQEDRAGGRALTGEIEAEPAESKSGTADSGQVRRRSESRRVPVIQMRATSRLLVILSMLSLAFATSSRSDDGKSPQDNPRAALTMFRSYARLEEKQDYLHSSNLPSSRFKQKLQMEENVKGRRFDVDDARDFTLLGSVAGKTKLPAIEERLGHAKHFRIKNYLDPLLEVCYVASGTDHTRVKFTAHAEGNLLSGIQVAAGSVKVRWESNCTVSNMISEAITTESGLRLGLSRTAVIERFGVPNRTDLGTLAYESDRRLTEREIKEQCGGNAYCSQIQWWLHAEINLTFRNDRLISFDIYRSPAN